MSSAARSVDDDATLVARSLEGDDGAWKRLVERHGPVIWAVANRAGLTRDDAADVFQNTWTIAVTDLERIREPARFGAWIARVARHQCMRVRRGYGIARRSYEQVAREDVVTDLPDEELSRIEDRQRISRALRQIGKRCIELLEALYYQRPKPSYEVISRRMGMSIGSIGPTRARCLSKLESRLEGESGD
jgi:RNA polymerase sigma factor (sigma-70 family)